MQECRIILEGGLEAIQKLCFETLRSSKYISESAQVIEMIAKEGVTASKGFGGLSREGILRCGAYPRHGEQKKMERSKQPYVDTDVKQSMKEGYCTYQQSKRKAEVRTTKSWPCYFLSHHSSKNENDL